MAPLRLCVIQRNNTNKWPSHVAYFRRSIMTDLYYLSQTDGAGDWREKEAKDLTELVQRRITYLQVRRLGQEINLEWKKNQNKK